MPFTSILKKDIKLDDLIYLTDLKIKKITRYDIDKTSKNLEKLEYDIDEVVNNINHINDYTILFFEKILKKYGQEKERKTKRDP